MSTTTMMIMVMMLTCVWAELENGLLHNTNHFPFSYSHQSFSIWRLSKKRDYLHINTACCRWSTLYERVCVTILPRFSFWVNCEIHLNFMPCPITTTFSIDNRTKCVCECAVFFICIVFSILRFYLQTFDVSRVGKYILCNIHKFKYIFLSLH